MLESSHRDVIDIIPSLALDTRIPAGMTITRGYPTVIAAWLPQSRSQVWRILKHIPAGMTVLLNKMPTR